MKCQTYFLGKGKVSKNITNLSSTELAWRVLKVSYTKDFKYEEATSSLQKFTPYCKKIVKFRDIP